MYNRIQAILISNNSLERHKIRKQLDKYKDIEIINEVSNPDDAIDLINQLNSGVILLHNQDSVKTTQEKKIFLKDGQKSYFINQVDIFMIESIGNYARFYFKDDTCLMHRSLKQVQEQLDAELFFRANRKQIINLNYIQHIETLPKGGINLKLIKGISIEMSSRSSIIFKKLKMI